jgi:hypothetical protein
MLASANYGPEEGLSAVGDVVNYAMVNVDEFRGTKSPVVLSVNVTVEIWRA